MLMLVCQYLLCLFVIFASMYFMAKGSCSYIETEKTGRIRSG